MPLPTTVATFVNDTSHLSLNNLSPDVGNDNSLLGALLASVALIWYCAMWIISIVGCAMSRSRFRHRPRSPLASVERSQAPGVSILRPLKGLDTNLYENLESTFTQDYPNFEILHCVADADDQALGVVRALIEKYPHVDAKIMIGEEIVGVNPKVNNLVRSYSAATNDILWTLDSNVYVSPGVCARSVDALLRLPSAKQKRRIGLVHHVPFAFGAEQGWGARLDEAFLNTNHAKMYVAINTFALESCVVGKSNMFRRSDVDRLTGNHGKASSPHSDTASSAAAKTGLAAFGRFLAEDNAIGTALWHELDLRHDISCDVAGNAIGNVSLSGYIERRVRWIRVRKRMVLAATILEPFTECIMLSVLACLSFRRLFGVPAWVVLVLHYVAWIALDFDVYDSLAGHYLPTEKRLSFLGAWCVRELLAFPIWISGIVGDDVQWRGRRYRMLSNGEVALAPVSSQTSLLSRIGLLGSRRRKSGYSMLDNEAI